MSKIKLADPGYVLRRKKHERMTVPGPVAVEEIKTEVAKEVIPVANVKKGKGKGGKGSKKGC